MADWHDMWLTYMRLWVQFPAPQRRRGGGGRERRRKKEQPSLAKEIEEVRGQGSWVNRLRQLFLERKGSSLHTWNKSPGTSSHTLLPSEGGGGLRSSKRVDRYPFSVPPILATSISPTHSSKESFYIIGRGEKMHSLAVFFAYSFKKHLSFF
jgi:hypothetical protein